MEISGLEGDCLRSAELEALPSAPVTSERLLYSYFKYICDIDWG